jgi:hypothetical protein
MFWARAAQTMVAMVAYWISPVRVHAAINPSACYELDTIFEQVWSSQVYEKTGDALKATRKCLPGDRYISLEKMLDCNLKRAFSTLPHDEAIGLVFGESPMIEMIAEYYGAKVEHGLAILEGYSFTMEEGGSIIAEPIPYL